MNTSWGSHCPACGSVVASEQFCPWCGLDLQGGEAAQLRGLVEHVRVLDERISGLSRERQAVAAELQRRRFAFVRAPERGPTPAPAFAPGGQPEWTAARARNLLLWVGAAMLAASALTFTAVAWGRLGDGGRALLLAAVTVVFTLLAVVSRKRLPASAQAFTGLSIVLVLVDWRALQRAGVSGSLSSSAWWAIGAGVAGAFAYGLGRFVGARVGRVAGALLLPVALELVVVNVAGAAWSGGLGAALVAAVCVGAVRVARHEDERAMYGLHAFGAWMVGASVTALAVVDAHSFAGALAPALVVGALGLAPAIALRLRVAPSSDDVFWTVVFGVPLGAYVAVMAPVFGPQGLLAWSALLGSLAFTVAADALPSRLRASAYVAAGAFVAPGLLWAGAAALATTFGPLGWWRYSRQPSLSPAAREVLTGPEMRHAFTAGWPMIAILVAVAAAGAFVGARARQLVLAVVAGALAVAAACAIPVVSGASAGAALVVATAVLCLVIVAVVAVDHVAPRVAGALVPVGVVAAAPAAGWCGMTRSPVVPAVVAVVALLAAARARSVVVRAAFAGASCAAAIAVGGVWADRLASGAGPVGLTMAAVAAVALLAAVHVRARTTDGLVVECTAAVGIVFAILLAATSVVWLATTMTVLVPAFLLAALRRERARVYGAAALLAALAAMWAWLANAHVTVVEAYTVPAAVVALLAGLLGWQRGPARSWLTLGPAIALGLGPTLVLGIANDDATRTLVAAALATAVMLFGAWQRLQAPLVLGAIALLALAADTFGPAVLRLPRWVPLAVIGVLLMWVGATFERRRDRARQATRTLSHFG